MYIHVINRNGHRWICISDITYVNMSICSYSHVYAYLHLHLYTYSIYIHIYLYCVPILTPLGSSAKTSSCLFSWHKVGLPSLGLRAGIRLARLMSFEQNWHILWVPWWPSRDYSELSPVTQWPATFVVVAAPSDGSEQQSTSEAMIYLCHEQKLKLCSSQVPRFGFCCHHSITWHCWHLHEVARWNAGCPVKFEFQKNNKIIF